MGHIATDGLMHAGAVLRADRQGLNLNEPGVVRALLSWVASPIERCG